jgi:hypothetical protein
MKITKHLLQRFEERYSMTEDQVYSMIDNIIYNSTSYSTSDKLESVPYIWLKNKLVDPSPRSKDIIYIINEELDMCIINTPSTGSFVTVYRLSTAYNRLSINLNSY